MTAPAYASSFARGRLAEEPHQEERDDDVPVVGCERDLANPVGDLGSDASLFKDLSDGGLLQGLPGLDVALGQYPDVRIALGGDQQNLLARAAATHDDSAGLLHGHERIRL